MMYLFDETDTMLINHFECGERDSFYALPLLVRFGVTPWNDSAQGYKSILARLTIKLSVYPPQHVARVKQARSTAACTSTAHFNEPVSSWDTTTIDGPVRRGRGRSDVRYIM